MCAWAACELGARLGGDWSSLRASEERRHQHPTERLGPEETRDDDGGHQLPHEIFLGDALGRAAVEVGLSEGVEGRDLGGREGRVVLESGGAHVHLEEEVRVGAWGGAGG